MTSNRRRWIRFHDEEPRVRVRDQSDQLRDVIVVDESFGGLAFLVDSVEGLDIGKVIEIEYYGGKPMKAFVRNAFPAEDGKTRIGVVWNDSKSETKEGV